MKLNASFVEEVTHIHTTFRLVSILSVGLRGKTSGLIGSQSFNSRSRVKQELMRELEHLLYGDAKVHLSKLGAEIYRLQLLRIDQYESLRTLLDKIAESMHIEVVEEEHTELPLNDF